METVILEEGTSEILETWTLLMWQLAEDMAEAEEHLANLTNRIRTKERVHQQDLAYYEEMQNEIEENHKKALQKEREARRREVSALRQEVEESAREATAAEEELRAAMELKAELLQRLHSALGKKEAPKQADTQIQQEPPSKELRRLRDQIAVLEKELKVAKDILAEESDKCFQEGMRIGRKMAELEEIAVLEELEMLKELERSLEVSLERSDSVLTLRAAMAGGECT